MATRGSIPNAAAVSALHAAMEARSWLLGLTLTAQSPYTITCAAHRVRHGEAGRKARTLCA